MTREVAIRNLEMIRIAFVDPVTKEQRKLIDDTVDMAISALSENKAEDRPKGEWILDETDNSVECNKCLCQIYPNDISYGEPHFCPNCGADMREVSEWQNKTHLK